MNHDIVKIKIFNLSKLLPDAKKILNQGVIACTFFLGCTLLPNELSGADNSAAFEIPYYTGLVYPTPQNVKYADEFLSLSNTGIILGDGMKNDDARLKILNDRITAAGGKVEIINSFSNKYNTVISLGDNDLNKQLFKGNVPDKPEGYAIYPTVKDKTNVVILKGHDKLGFLWSIISFNQLVTTQGEKAVVKKAEVSDFPATQERGFITNSWSGTGSDWAWFTVRAKLNVLYLSSESKRYGNKKADYWRNELSPEYKANLQEIGKILNPLGIAWYDSVRPIIGNPEEKIASKSDADFNAVYKLCCDIADAGGNVSLFYDDTRYPISPGDMKDFGTSLEADIYFLNKLYTAMKAKYPKIKLTFCPPFYWGPLHTPGYPENREEYLTALGTRLPADIGIFWTGPAVSSQKITKADVDWITALIKRKPILWQNGCGGPHAYGYHYVTDPLTSWKDWYYDGFANDVQYMFNTNMPHNTASTLTLNDSLWNPGAYDAGKSIEDAAKKLTGPETYPSLLKLNQALSYFDKYGYKVSPGAAKNIKEIKEKSKELESAWQECLKYHPEAVKKWTSLERHVTQQKSFLDALEKNPDLTAFVKQIENVKELAVKEAKYNQASDIFLSPYDFNGGNLPKLYSFRCEKRLMTYLNGLKTNLNKMSAGFNLATPPEADYSLIISGQDNDSGPRCKIMIVVNDNIIFKGENSFIRYGWSVCTFPIKASFLKEGSNSISIQCIEDSGNTSGPPFFIFNYAVIKKNKK